MAYTNDLVRLAASMKIVIDAKGLSIKMKEGCDAILEGYSESLSKGGRPIVLEEHEQKLGKMGVDSFSRWLQTSSVRWKKPCLTRECNTRWSGGRRD
jgi:uncharacterized protein (DUF2252 family)